MARMERDGGLKSPHNDPVESARATDATARRVAADVVRGLMATAHA
jgi:hypothetical protein